MTPEQRAQHIIDQHFAGAAPALRESIAQAIRAAERAQLERLVLAINTYLSDVTFSPGMLKKALAHYEAISEEPTP